MSEVESKTKVVCAKCSRRFHNRITAEKKLLRAIFGRAGNICEKCFAIEEEEACPICHVCSKSTDGSLQLSGLPIHPECYVRKEGERSK